MTRLTERQALKMGIIPPRSLKNKYGNMRVRVDGLTFDSKKEALKYEELKLLKQAGEIVDFELQPGFILQEGFTTKEGRKILPITYRADFKVIYPGGRVVYIDTKGHRTKEYLLKRKMLLFRYPEIEFIEE